MTLDEWRKGSIMITHKEYWILHAREIQEIATETDYKSALACIDAFMDAEINTVEGKELDRLTNLVVEYEARQ